MLVALSFLVIFGCCTQEPGPGDDGLMDAGEQPTISEAEGAWEDLEMKDGKVALSDAEWKKRLTPEQYYVCREKGTERARTGAYWDCKKDGTYLCAACGQELFESDTKFKSGTGWPSFWEPANKEAVAEHIDRSLPFQERVEVTCSRCDSHLGHVFPDGPNPTGLRYCINSVSLLLREPETPEEK